MDKLTAQAWAKHAQEKLDKLTLYHPEGIDFVAHTNHGVVEISSKDFADYLSALRAQLAQPPTDTPPSPNLVDDLPYMFALLTNSRVDLGTTVVS